MAIFHLSAKIVSRGRGQSVVAKAAYNFRGELINEKTGERHNYRNTGEVLFSGIFAPKNAPAWAQDRQKLWSEVEKAETRKNSQLAREIEVALPHELTDKQREWLLKDFVRENFARHGMVADVSLHGPSKEGDGRNYHAHILLTMREIGPEGFGAKMRELNSRAQLEVWRERWEYLANRHLERHGHEARIDRRTLEAQGIDREPTIHEGVTATRLERNGIKTARGDINRSIEESNRHRERLETAHRATALAIEEIERKHGARMAATLYDRADMASMQRDAMRHMKDALKEREKREKKDRRKKEEEAREVEKRREKQPDKEKRGEDRPRSAEQEKSEHRRATTEQTDSKQRSQGLEEIREMRDKLLDTGTSKRNRDDGSERER